MENLYKFKWKSWRPLPSYASLISGFSAAEIFVGPAFRLQQLVAFIRTRLARVFDCQWQRADKSPT